MICCVWHFIMITCVWNMVIKISFDSAQTPWRLLVVRWNDAQRFVSEKEKKKREKEKQREKERKRQEKVDWQRRERRQGHLGFRSTANGVPDERKEGKIVTAKQKGWAWWLRTRGDRIRRNFKPITTPDQSECSQTGKALFERVNLYNLNDIKMRIQLNDNKKEIWIANVIRSQSNWINL